MDYFVDLTLCLGIVGLYGNVARLLETEGMGCCDLILLGADKALNKCDFLSHFAYLPLTHDFFDGLAPYERNLIRCAEAGKTLNGGSYNIVRVVGAQRLGSYVLYAGGFKHGTDGTASDNAGTRCGGLEQDFACAKLTDNFMGNCRTLERNLDEVLLGVLDALADCVRNLACLTDAEADVLETRLIATTVSLSSILDASILAKVAPPP